MGAIRVSVRCRPGVKVSLSSSTSRTASKLRRAKATSIGRNSTTSRKRRVHSTSSLRITFYNMLILRQRLRTSTAPIPALAMSRKVLKPVLVKCSLSSKTSATTNASGRYMKPSRRQRTRPRSVQNTRRNWSSLRQQRATFLRYREMENCRA